MIEIYDKLIVGCNELSPWVMENCPHVTMEKLQKEGVSIRSAWKSLLSHAGPDTVYVAHNLSFDWNIVVKYSKELLVDKGMKLLDLQPRLCTKEISTNLCKLPKTGKSRWFAGSRWKWPTLEELAQKLDVEITGALHDALTDVRVLKACFFAAHERGWW